MALRRKVLRGGDESGVVLLAVLAFVAMLLPVSVIILGSVRIESLLPNNHLLNSYALEQAERGVEEALGRILRDEGQTVSPYRPVINGEELDDLTLNPRTGVTEEEQAIQGRILGGKTIHGFDYLAEDWARHPSNRSFYIVEGTSPEEDDNDFSENSVLPTWFLTNVPMGMDPLPAAVDDTGDAWEQRVLLCALNDPTVPTPYGAPNGDYVEIPATTMDPINNTSPTETGGVPVGDDWRDPWDSLNQNFNRARPGSWARPGYQNFGTTNPAYTADEYYGNPLVLGKVSVQQWANPYFNRPKTYKPALGSITNYTSGPALNSDSIPGYYQTIVADESGKLNINMLLNVVFPYRPLDPDEVLDIDGNEVLDAQDNPWDPSSPSYPVVVGPEQDLDPRFRQARDMLAQLLLSETDLAGLNDNTVDIARRKAYFVMRNLMWKRDQMDYYYDDVTYTSSGTGPGTQAETGSPDYIFNGDGRDSSGMWPAFTSIKEVMADYLDISGDTPQGIPLNKADFNRLKHYITVHTFDSEFPADGDLWAGVWNGQNNIISNFTLPLETVGGDDVEPAPFPYPQSMAAQFRHFSDQTTAGAGGVIPAAPDPTYPESWWNLETMGGRINIVKLFQSPYDDEWYYPNLHYMGINQSNWDHYLTPARVNAIMAWRAGLVDLNGDGDLDDIFVRIPVNDMADAGIDSALRSPIAVSYISYCEADYVPPEIADREDPETYFHERDFLHNPADPTIAIDDDPDTYPAGRVWNVGKYNIPNHGALLSIPFSDRYDDQTPGDEVDPDTNRPIGIWRIAYEYSSDPTDQPTFQDYDESSWPVIPAAGGNGVRDIYFGWDTDISTELENLSRVIGGHADEINDALLGFPNLLADPTAAERFGASTAFRRQVALGDPNIVGIAGLLADSQDNWTMHDLPVVPQHMVDPLIEFSDQICFENARPLTTEEFPYMLFGNYSGDGGFGNYTPVMARINVNTAPTPVLAAVNMSMFYGTLPPQIAEPLNDYQDSQTPLEILDDPVECFQLASLFGNQIAEYRTWIYNNRSSTTYTSQASVWNEIAYEDPVSGDNVYGDNPATAREAGGGSLKSWQPLRRANPFAEHIDPERWSEDFGGNPLAYPIRTLYDPEPPFTCGGGVFNVMRYAADSVAGTNVDDGGLESMSEDDLHRTGNSLDNELDRYYSSWGPMYVSLPYRPANTAGGGGDNTNLAREILGLQGDTNPLPSLKYFPNEYEDLFANTGQPTPDTHPHISSSDGTDSLSFNNHQRYRLYNADNFRDISRFFTVRTYVYRIESKGIVRVTSDRLNTGVEISRDIMGIYCLQNNLFEVQPENFFSLGADIGSTPRGRDAGGGDDIPYFGYQLYKYNRSQLLPEQYYFQDTDPSVDDWYPVLNTGPTGKRWSVLEFETESTDGMQIGTEVYLPD